MRQTLSKLLLTCPHAGTQELDKPRVKRDLPSTCKAYPGEHFKDKNDECTLELTRSIASNIQRLCGKKPHEVIGNFHRRYIDYNRHEECAIEQSSLLAKARYLEYHNGIIQKIEEMIPENYKGLAFLFDIHGTARTHVKVGNKIYPLEVLIGTDEESSIQALTKVDPHAWWGTKGLIPLLRDKGVRVFTPNRNLEEQNRILDGGYTIQTYGSSQCWKGLVAVQIEVISSIRKDPAYREKLSEDMADCIYQFVSPFT